MKLTSKLLDGYIPSTLLSKDLGILPSDFNYTLLEKIIFKKITLIKVPQIALGYIRSDVYMSSVLLETEAEAEYEYVLCISKKVRVGFWK